MKQDYNDIDEVMEEFNKHPIRCQLWANSRAFYIKYLWPILHPLRYRDYKKHDTTSIEDDLKKLHAEMHKRELMQKYNLTEEQLADKLKHLFEDDDTDS